MKVSIIVAVAENGVIGRGGKLPWRLADDLKRFKKLTMGHTIIMGRKTWESIGRPLRGRRMIVVSRQPANWVDVNSVERVTTLDDALDLARAVGETEAFIIGGEAIYREALPCSDRIYLTIVKAAVEGDVFFPEKTLMDEKIGTNWVPLAIEEHPADARNEYPYAFCTLQRCEPKQQVC